MSFAIIKLSYINPGDDSLVGGVCGTGFFVNNYVAVTANHVLNIDTFTPNAGCHHVMVWIISRRGTAILLKRADIETFPEIDTTILRLDGSMPNREIYKISDHDVALGLPVRAIGHVGNAMPRINAGWEGTFFRLYSASLDGVACDADRNIKRCLTINVNANDIRMQNVSGLELSFGSCVGMSGGPVIDKNLNMVVGMLSIGLPPDSAVKSATFAVAAHEIKRRI